MTARRQAPHPVRLDEDMAGRARAQAAADRFDAARQLPNILHDGQAGARVYVDVTAVLVDDDELHHATRPARRYGAGDYSRRLAPGAAARSARVVRIESAAIVATAATAGRQRGMAWGRFGRSRFRSARLRRSRRHHLLRALRHLIGARHDRNLLGRLEREIGVLEPFE